MPLTPEAARSGMLSASQVSLQESGLKPALQKRKVSEEGAGRKGGLSASHCQHLECVSSNPGEKCFVHPLSMILACCLGHSMPQPEHRRPGCQGSAEQLDQYLQGFAHGAVQL